MNCAVIPCGLPADRTVTYNHPDEKLRWSHPMCAAHAREAFDMQGAGEFEFSPLPEEPKGDDAKDEGQSPAKGPHPVS